MHSQAGIANVADVYNLSKYNSRIMAAFLPEYENETLWIIKKIRISERSKFELFMQIWLFLS